jgi:hypothetical protein
MDTQIYQILIDSSYDELPIEAKHYVNRLVTKVSKKPFVLSILKGFHSSAIKSNNVDVLLSGAFIDSDPFEKAGCFWYLKIKIFLFIYSLLTGVTIPKLLKKNFCLFLQSLVIASYLAKEGYVNESPYDWDYE